MEKETCRNREKGKSGSEVRFKKGELLVERNFIIGRGALEAWR